VRILFSKFNLFVFIFFIGASAFAGTNYLYSFGGAGDAPLEENIFADEFIGLNQFAKKNQWQTTTLFDGDQPDAQLKVSKAIQDPNLKSFTGGAFQIQLENIATKKFNPGDKVLLIIDTHGAQISSENGHYIACQGNGICDTGDLKAIIDRLQTQGVQVALMDFSCYSGQSLKMANNKTCVISTASNDDVGSIDTTDNFIKNMKSGKSLEEVYLEMRKNKNNWSLPRISSPAGFQAEKIIRSLAPESQLELSVDENDNMLRKDVGCNCSPDDQLKKSLSQSEEILINSIKTSKIAKQYIDASIEYQTLYNQAALLAKKIKIYASKITLVDGSIYTLLTLANVDDKNPNKEVITKKKELEQSSAEFRQLEKDIQSYDALIKLQEHYGFFNRRKGGSPLTDAALKTQKYESKLYQELYRSYQGQKENPCANFIL